MGSAFEQWLNTEFYLFINGHQPVGVKENQLFAQNEDGKRDIVIRKRIRLEDNKHKDMEYAIIEAKLVYGHYGDSQTREKLEELKEQVTSALNNTSPSNCGVSYIIYFCTYAEVGVLHKKNRKTFSIEGESGFSEYQSECEQRFLEEFNSIFSDHAIPSHDKPNLIMKDNSNNSIWQTNYDWLSPSEQWFSQLKVWTGNAREPGAA
jgi:hypothetical protein